VKSGTKVQYYVQFSKRRKTILLRITDEGDLKVYAPYRTKRERIEKVITSHQTWIDKKIEEIQLLPQPLPQHTYQDNDIFIIHNRRYTLNLIKSETTQVYTEDASLIVKSPKLSAKVVKKLIENFYDTYGLELFHTLVAKWIKNLHLESIEYSVTMVNYPKRLGSCSSQHILSFARRSLMLPLDMLDYLALHEVAHLVYFNHGAAFKQLLFTHMNDYKERFEGVKRFRFMISHI
jgi:predicted metal-dependent hydrolase